jgi:hypothetical protein
LGRAATPRLVGANIGVAALTIGLALDTDGLTISGLLLIAAALGLTAAQLVGAVISGIRNARSARP